MSVVGGHVGPVQFRLDDMEVSPYSLPPWLPAEAPDTDPVLQHLRGDFFCLPFGDPAGGLAHGEVANAPWTIVESTATFIAATLTTEVPAATFRKEVHLQEEQTALYQRVTSSDLTGSWNYGTHPVLDLSREQARISTSRLQFGAVSPGLFSDPARGETQILAPGSRFTDVTDVPTLAGDSIDLSRYPTSAAHEDLVALVGDPDSGPLGWTAVTCADYAWIALKDLRRLPTTLLWMSNGGRTAAPWSGRHTGRIGIEDVCSYFALGLAASLDNPFIGSGVPTHGNFDESHRLDIPTVQLVVPASAGFDRVAHIDALPHGRLRVHSESGELVETSVDWEFVLD